MEEDSEIVSTTGPAAVSISTSPALFQRALLLADTFLRCAESRGHDVFADANGVGLRVVGEVFRFSIVEAMETYVIQPADKKLRREYLAAQARKEKWLLPHERPTNYSWQRPFDDGKRHYDLTGERPNGHLVLDVQSLKKWRDRFSRKVEEYVAAAVLAIEAEAEERPIRARRAQEEWTRRELEAYERRRREDREAIRQSLARRRKAFLAEQTTGYVETLKIKAYLEAIEPLTQLGANGPLERFVKDTRKIVSERLSIRREELERKILELGLYPDESADFDDQ